MFIWKMAHLHFFFSLLLCNYNVTLNLKTEQCLLTISNKELYLLRLEFLSNLTKYQNYSKNYLKEMEFSIILYGSPNSMG